MTDHRAPELFIAFILGVAATSLVLLFSTDHGKSVAELLWSQEGAGWAQAVGTLVAIAATGMIANWQHQKTLEIERSRLAREEFASRTLLTIALSEIVENAAAALKSLDQAHSSFSPFSTIHLAKPSISRAALENIRESMRVSDAEIASELAELLKFVQVHEARWDSLAEKGPHGGLGHRIEIVQGVRDAADLYCLAERLFPYARGETNLPSSGAVIDRYSALTVNGLEASEYPELFRQA
jgi:hypothetical protein